MYAPTRLYPQCVVVGIEHPVLYATGNIAVEASVLEAICPPDCINISHTLYSALGKQGVRGVQGPRVMRVGADDQLWVNEDGVPNGRGRNVGRGWQPGNCRGTIARY